MSLSEDMKRAIARLWGRLLAVAECYSVMLLCILAVHLAAQTAPRGRVGGYNYDPTSDMVAETVRQGQRIARVEGEVEDLKQKQKDDLKTNVAANIESRISHLEANQDANKQLLIGIAVALGMLVVEAAQRRLSNAK